MVDTPPTPPSPSDALPKIFFWTEYFETGFPEIDLQHRGLVNLINEIPSALATGMPGAPYPADLLLRLREYASYHFRTEEAIWDRIPRIPPFDVPLDRHEKEHRSFAEKVAQLDRQLGDKGLDPEKRKGILSEIVVYLIHWLAHHILEFDREMALALKALEAGATPGQAMKIAERKLDRTAVFTRTILSMYDSLVEQSMVLISEIDRRRRAEEEAIRTLAYYDPLTALPNRRLLNERVDLAIVATDRYKKRGAIFFIDLDNFKMLNDTLGHDMGDRLLLEVAGRLRKTFRSVDTLARLGGDEFVVMVENLPAAPIEAAQEAEALATKMIEALRKPYDLGKERHYTTTPSVGIALFGGQKLSREELLKQADMAMYQAKAAGRNGFRFFDQTMETRLKSRSSLEQELQAAVTKGQFVLYFQPQCKKDGSVVGAEALIRWNHPEKGLLFPDTFISLAEETGIIIPIGQWVLEESMRKLGDWARTTKLPKDFSLGVNLSVRQFREEGLIDNIDRLLRSQDIPPNAMTLEVTESLLILNPEKVRRDLQRLRETGVLFSLDDFGTGYSSLQYIRQLPLDQLKIDRSFVQEIGRDKGDRTIVTTILAMAKALDLTVVAEGVETSTQRDILDQSRCQIFQGYFFARPLPEAAFLERLTSYSPPPASRP